MVSAHLPEGPAWGVRRDCLPAHLPKCPGSPGLSPLCRRKGGRRWYQNEVRIRGSKDPANNNGYYSSREAFQNYFFSPPSAHPPDLSDAIHFTDGELAQVALKSVLPDSRSPAFSLDARLPLGKNVNSPILQLGILSVGTHDGV